MLSDMIPEALHSEYEDTRGFALLFPRPPGRVKPLHQIRTSTPRVHRIRTARDSTHGRAER